MSQALPPPFRQMATTPSARNWPGLAITASHPPHAATANSFTSSSRALSVKRWGGRSGSRHDTRDGQVHVRPRSNRNNKTGLGTTIDDICDSPLPPVAAHTTSAPIARFCLLACCRTLPLVTVRSSSDIHCCLTLSEPAQGAKSASPG